MDEAVLLLSQYCDNDLSTEDEAKLAVWLQQDTANVDRFVRATLLNSQVQDLIQEHRLQSDAWSHTLRDEEAIKSSGTSATPRPAPSISRNLGMLAVAALLVGILTTSILLPRLSRPAVVAQVTSLTGAAMTDDGQPLAVGSLLPAGESLKIADGNVLITFECGAKVFVEGPATFVVTNAQAGMLSEGKASARVPTQAIGFAIQTPLLDVVDLGTEFQLILLNKEQLDLHVFDGLVEVQLNRKFRHAEDGPLQISEGRSARFDLQANEITTLNYDESLKRAF